MCIRDRVKQALATQQIDFTLAFNAGFYAIYSASQDVQVMLGRAKTACWSAEKQELLLCQYDQRLIDTLNQEHAMTAALPGALRDGQFMIVLQPVSYTHLDVYKRQPFLLSLYRVLNAK